MKQTRSYRLLQIYFHNRLAHLARSTCFLNSVKFASQSRLPKSSKRLRLIIAAIGWCVRFSLSPMLLRHGASAALHRLSGIVLNLTIHPYADCSAISKSTMMLSILWPPLVMLLSIISSASFLLTSSMTCQDNARKVIAYTLTIRFNSCVSCV